MSKHKTHKGTEFGTHKAQTLRAIRRAKYATTPLDCDRLMRELSTMGAVS